MTPWPSSITELVAAAWAMITGWLLLGAARRNQHIARLDIAVNQSPRVRGGEPASDLREQAHRPLRRQASLAPQH